MNRKAIYKDYYDLPTFEGLLQYDPQELVEDELLTFYRLKRIRNRDGRMVTIRYALKPWVSDSAQTKRKKGGREKPNLRRKVSFIKKGVVIHPYCSHLTMLAMTGFSIADRRHYVIDHIDGDSLNDRPSNLQVITQSENIRRSPKAMKHAKELSQIRKQKRQENLELLKNKKQ